MWSPSAVEEDRKELTPWPWTPELLKTQVTSIYRPLALTWLQGRPSSIEKPRKHSVDTDSLWLTPDLGVHTCPIFCCFYPPVSRAARMSQLTTPHRLLLMWPAHNSGASQGLRGKESACQWEWVWFLSQEDPPGEGNGNPFQYSCLEIPWTVEPGGLQFKGSQRVGHNLATEKQYMTPDLLEIRAPISCSVGKDMSGGQRQIAVREETSMHFAGREAGTGGQEVEV